jgi:hypothetical protein
MKLIYSLINLILLLSLLIWPLGIFGTMFMFDAPGSERNPITICLAISILAYPIPVLKGNAGFWRNRKEGSLAICKNYTLIGLIGPASILILVALLQVVCGGNFVCK